MQIGVTYLLTATIGWQREQEEHNAGVRTFPIVGMASCGYLLILGQGPDVNAQSRVLEGLITGIGFIGGGAILKEGLTVRGTATAASVWNACDRRLDRNGTLRHRDCADAAELVQSAGAVAAQNVAGPRPGRRGQEIVAACATARRGVAGKTRTLRG
jgi:hypothetical protein